MDNLEPPPPLRSTWFNYAPKLSWAKISKHKTIFALTQLFYLYLMYTYLRMCLISDSCHITLNPYLCFSCLITHHEDFDAVRHINHRF